MPTFRTRPSSNLNAAIRRAVASGGSNLGALGEIQADQAAARTNRDQSLADKARMEVETMQQAQAMRNDPAVRTEYAGHVAGIDTPDATRLYKAISGTRERPVVEMDNGDEGMDAPEGVQANRMPDVTYAKPENLPAGSERLFRSALASTLGNNIATGKTNATQLAQAGDRVNETALTNQAANTESVPEANRIIAAVAGKIREPFKVGPHGQVLNEEVGTVNEDTRIARAAAALSAARATTEGSKQAELGSRAEQHDAAAGLADERAAAVVRAADRGGARVSPQQVERWASEVARREWDTIPAKERKGMNYQQHLDKVRARFQGGPAGGGATDVVGEAHAAIEKGADPIKVGKRFKERMGFDLPAPVKTAAPAAADDEAEEE